MELTRPKDWYAAHVRSNQEQVVAAILAAKGLEPYNPSFRDRRQWSDRIRETERPLFPGYLFCRMSSEDRVAVQKTSGVVRIVGVGTQPAPVDEVEMEAIRTLAATDVRHRPCPYLEVGDEVQILGGPLSGMSGILQDAKSGSGSGKNLVVSVTLLRRSIAVAIQDRWMVVSARRRPVSGNPVPQSLVIG